MAENTGTLLREPAIVQCRNGHTFGTRAKGGSTVSCPACREDAGRVAVWVPVQRDSAPARTGLAADGLAAGVASALEALQRIERILAYRWAPADSDDPDGLVSASDSEPADIEALKVGRIHGWHAELRHAGVHEATTDAVAVTLGVSAGVARDRLRQLEAYGLAVRTTPPRQRTQRWTLVES